MMESDYPQVQFTPVILKEKRNKLLHNVLHGISFRTFETKYQNMMLKYSDDTGVVY